jgi:hypothetical protein
MRDDWKQTFWLNFPLLSQNLRVSVNQTAWFYTVGVNSAKSQSELKCLLYMSALCFAPNKLCATLNHYLLTFVQRSITDDVDTIEAFEGDLNSIWYEKSQLMNWIMKPGNIRDRGIK